MRWIKKGIIFSNDNVFGELSSYAQCPIPLLRQNVIRVFFAARSKEVESFPVYLDVDSSNPKKIIKVATKPVLDKGERGTFDENGIIPNSILKIDDKLYMYYAGWSRCANVPYKNFTGLAISNDLGNNFSKFSAGPVFGLNKIDSLSATGPFVVEYNGNYATIYSTGTGWHEIDGHLEHTYLLTYATSADAIDWQPSGKIIIKPKDEFEAMCKPTIIKLGNTYHMWFSTRGSHDFRKSGVTAYRIGYAYSNDLINWTRDDSKAGIDVSESGWDSEMICYPYIIEVNGKYLMFYNGNGFGKSGFGYAELEM